MVRLTDKAVITSLHLSAWGGRKTDSRAVKLICDGSNSSQDMHVYSKWLLQPKALDPIRRAQRQAHYAWMCSSKPWLESAQRITPKTRYLELAETVREKRMELQKAVEDFIASLPQLKREAKARLGSLYSEENYPTADELRSSFDIRLSAYPVPIADDWRMGLDGDGEKEAKENLASQLKEAETELLKEIWEGLLSSVQRVVSQLEDKDKVNGKTLTALKTVLQETAEFNMLEDPKLEKMRQRIESTLAELTPNAGTDNKTKSKVEKVMKDMEAYMGTL